MSKYTIITKINKDNGLIYDFNDIFFISKITDGDDIAIIIDEKLHFLFFNVYDFPCIYTIVITDKNIYDDNVCLCSSFEEAILISGDYKKIFIIGDGHIFNLALTKYKHLMKEAYITVMKNEYNGEYEVKPLFPLTLLVSDKSTQIIEKNDDYIRYKIY